MRETLLKARARLVQTYQVNSICKETSRGDWFILYQLGKNIDPVIFREFLVELEKKFRENNNGYMR